VTLRSAPITGLGRHGRTIAGCQQERGVPAVVGLVQRRALQVEQHGYSAQSGKLCLAYCTRTDTLTLWEPKCVCADPLILRLWLSSPGAALLHRTSSMCSFTQSRYPSTQSRQMLDFSGMKLPFCARTRPGQLAPLASALRSYHP